MLPNFIFEFVNHIIFKTTSLKNFSFTMITVRSDGFSSLLNLCSMHTCSAQRFRIAIPFPLFEILSQILDTNYILMPVQCE